ncbi:hypothetical protein D3C81_1336120 [compost metagenome]
MRFGRTGAGQGQTSSQRLGHRQGIRRAVAVFAHRTSRAGEQPGIRFEGGTGTQGNIQQRSLRAGELFLALGRLFQPGIDLPPGIRRMQNLAGAEGAEHGGGIAGDLSFQRLQRAALRLNRRLLRTPRGRGLAVAVGNGAQVVLAHARRAVHFPLIGFGARGHTDDQLAQRRRHRNSRQEKTARRRFGWGYCGACDAASALASRKA